MIGRFVGTDTLCWDGKDCCRADFRGTDVRSPYYGDPSLWDDEGDPVPVERISEYIASRKTLEGIVLAGEPLRDHSLLSVLKAVRGTPVRIETFGTRPAELDDIAGALMADSVIVRLL